MVAGDVALGARAKERDEGGSAKVEAAGRDLGVLPVDEDAAGSVVEEVSGTGIAVGHDQGGVMVGRGDRGQARGKVAAQGPAQVGDAPNVLGKEGRGFYAIMGNFQNERIVLGAMAMGEASAALELTLDYVTTRKAFGSSLFEKQAVRQRLAMLAAKVEARTQLVHHAAWLEAQRVDCTREVSMVKAYCGQLVNEVMYACLQFHGGMGYMRESAIERMARDARVQSIGGGATEVMLEEVAKRLRR